MRSFVVSVVATVVAACGPTGSPDGGAGGTASAGGAAAAGGTTGGGSSGGGAAAGGSSGGGAAAGGSSGGGAAAGGSSAGGAAAGGSSGGGAAAGGSSGGGAAAGGTSGGGAAAGGSSGGAGLPAGSVSVRTLAAFSDRPYEVHVPSNYDGGVRPVLLMLHGGGGNRENGWVMSCPGADAGSANCLGTMALADGFIVVSPDGTPMGPGMLLSRLRTWNAGGGDGGWQCVSGRACADARVNEALYFGLLLADLGSVVAADPQRVFATGLSNGAALSHRLACQLPSVRAIASVAGGNQYSTLDACIGQKAIIEIHGTNDPCWNFDGGVESCADSNPGIKIAVADTMGAWASRNGCQQTRTSRTIADAGPSDITATIEHTWNGCPAGKEVVLLEVVNGGHTWPQGAEPRMSTSGTVSQGISANRYMLDFFKAH